MGIIGRQPWQQRGSREGMGAYSGQSQHNGKGRAGRGQGGEGGEVGWATAQVCYLPFHPAPLKHMHPQLAYAQ